MANIVEKVKPVFRDVLLGVEPYYIKRGYEPDTPEIDGGLPPKPRDRPSVFKRQHDTVFYGYM